MPRLSAFYGIVIYLYVRDHGPPHLHAIHGEDQASVDIATGDLVAGTLRPRQYRLVRSWVELHRAELLTAWELASAGEPPGTIDSLP
ncbi:MAG: DUF4160 domain-containing protein [Acidimicrobiales bacterium]